MSEQRILALKIGVISLDEKRRPLQRHLQELDDFPNGGPAGVFPAPGVPPLRDAALGPARSVGRQPRPQRGRPLDESLAGMRMVAEGVRTTHAALALGERHGVELPIASQMAEVLSGRQTPAEAVGNLMLRPQRD